VLVVRYFLGTLRLNFDEPVNATSLQVAGSITLHGDRSGIASNTLQLSGGSSSSASGPQLLIDLSVDDLNIVKRFEDLFSSSNDSFISFTNALVLDMNANPVEEVLPGTPIQTVLYTTDTTSPIVSSFDVDMAADPGTFTLHFAETVRVASLKMEYITLQTAFNFSRPGSSERLSLTGGNVTTMVDNTSISVTFLKADFDALKLKGYGVSNSSSWLTMDTAAIRDMAGTPSSPLVDGVNALRVSTLVLDTTPPQVEFFDLNMNSGKIDLFFSEPVDADSVRVEHFSMQNKLSSTGP